MTKIKSYAVLGLGGFGISIAKTLSEEGMEVLAMDIKKDLVNKIASNVTKAVQMDVTDEKSLRSVGVERVDGAIIAIGENLEATVMATLLLKEIGVPFVIVKAENDMQKTILEKIGADQVVFPEKEIGCRLAKKIAGNYIDYFELSDHISLVEMNVKNEWVGKSLKELDFRNKFHLNVIAVKSQGDIETFPNPDLPLQKADIIITAGNKRDFQNL